MTKWYSNASLSIIFYTFYCVSWIILIKCISFASADLSRMHYSNTKKCFYQPRIVCTVYTILLFMSITEINAAICLPFELGGKYYIR